MKRQNKKILPKSRAELDKFVRNMGYSPYGKISYRGREIFLSETEYENDQPREYPWGYYQTFWVITREDSDEKFQVGSWVEFDAMHDKEESLTPEGKRRARLETALQHAKKWIDSEAAVANA